MTPEQKNELAQLRRCTGSVDDVLRREELERIAAEPRGLRARLRGVVVRAMRVVGDMIDPVAPTPEVEIVHHDGDAVFDEPVEETPLEQAQRIRKEYLEGVERFQKQRDEWRGMWEESWPRHLTASRMMERILEDGRAQLVLLAPVATRELGASIQLGPSSMPGAPPVGMAAAFERTMLQLAADIADVDVPAERDRILSEESEADRRQNLLVETRSVNRKLFALISTIEEERNVWNERARTEQATHNGMQSKLQTAIEGASESHGRLLAAVNAKRAARNAKPIATRDDLERAALEATSVGP